MKNKTLVKSIFDLCIKISENSKAIKAFDLSFHTGLLTVWFTDADETGSYFDIVGIDENSTKLRLKKLLEKLKQILELRKGEK